MNVEKLKNDLKALSIAKTLEDPVLDAAIRKAGYDLAWHLDIPELQVSGTITVVSGTVSYDAEETEVDLEEIDRITSAVFQGTSVKQPLDEIDIRSFDRDYRGYATEGTPYEFTYFEGKIWLYYIPNISGTVYLRLQKIFTSFADFKENYYPLVFALAKRNIVDEKSIERQILDREVYKLIDSFKGRVRPYKNVMELNRHRAERVNALNNLY